VLSCKPNRRTDITDASVITIARCCPQLQHLNLNMTAITNQSLANIAIPNLKILELVGTNITDVGAIAFIPRCKELRTIHLSSTKVLFQLVIPVDSDLCDFLLKPIFLVADVLFSRLT
jgi:hypothetical protein